MAQENLYINSYCVIRNHRVVTPDGVCFEAGPMSAEAFLEKLYHFLEVSYPKFYKMDKLCQLGLLASEMMLKKGALLKHYDPAGVAIVLSNAHSSLDTDRRYFQSSKTLASPALFVYTLPNIVAGEICIRYGIKGENSFFIFRKFDPEAITAYVRMLMEQTPTQAVISGWVDVWDNTYDVFLYLVENSKTKGSLPHQSETIERLYNLTYGTIDSQPQKTDH